MNYYSLLKEFGANLVLPYVDWPGNVLTFCETALAIRLTPVSVITPKESRDMFYSKKLLEEKPKFTLLKQPCFVMDSKYWAPVVLIPIHTKSGTDCIYQVVTPHSKTTYTPSEELDFRKLVGYEEDIALYGFLKQN